MRKQQTEDKGRRGSNKLAGDKGALHHTLAKQQQKAARLELHETARVAKY